MPRCVPTCAGSWKSCLEQTLILLLTSVPANEGLCDRSVLGFLINCSGVVGLVVS